MLSYLKDGQSQTPAADEIQKSQDQQDAGLCQQGDFLTVSGQGKKLRQSTIILAVLFAVGAAAVWFMIKKTTPAAAFAAADEGQTQLEAALAQLNTMQAEVNSQMDSVVGRFYQFNNVEQVEVNELKKNPFKRESGKAKAGADTNNLAELELKHLRERAYQLASELELWSITSTPKGRCCMISDKLLYIGDTINDLTIKTISEKTVTLEYNGILVQLKISE
jgi:preprotein translocase subunit SecG